MAYLLSSNTDCRQIILPTLLPHVPEIDLYWTWSLYIARETFEAKGGPTLPYIQYKILEHLLAEGRKGEYIKEEELPLIERLFKGEYIQPSEGIRTFQNEPFEGSIEVPQRFHT